MRKLVALCALLATCAAVGADTVPAEFARGRCGRDWRDGMFIGDGQHGVLVYAPMHLEWLVNRNDLFDSRVNACDYLTHAEVCKRIASGEKHAQFLAAETAPQGGNDHRRTMSAATLKIRYWKGLEYYSPSAPSVSERVSTATGEHVMRVTAPWVDGTVTTLADRARDVVAVSVRDADGPHRHFIELGRIEDDRLETLPAWKTDGSAVSFEQKMPDGRTFAVALLVKGGSAKVETKGRDAFLVQTGDCDIFLAVRCSRAGRPPQEAALAAVRAAAADGFDALAASNRAWWQEFWVRGGRVSFPERPDIERPWCYSIYQLAASYGRPPMPGLNGLAYGPLDAHTAGCGSQEYTHDQNVQIPIFPFFAANHPEVVASFADTYLAVTNELARQTRRLFGGDGFGPALCINQDGVEMPIGGYRYTLCGPAYSGLVLSLGWRHSRDRRLLKEKIYPLLKGFLGHYEAVMSKGADGLYHVDWSVPPEIFTFTRDETAIVAMLKPCLETAVEAAEMFGCDAEKRAFWKDVLAHYPTPAKHPDGGWWCGPDVPANHYMFGGHLLYPFFPAGSFPDRATAEKTLDYIWKHAYEISHATVPPHPHHEWSTWLITATMLRLGQRDAAWAMIGRFLDWHAKPNGLFTHNPVIVSGLTGAEARANIAKAGRNRRVSFTGGDFDVPRGILTDLTTNPEAKRLAPSVIEGGAVFAFLINEALLQLRDGEVVLFPGIPNDMSCGFENFRTADGRTVSARMEKGKVVSRSVQ